MSILKALNQFLKSRRGNVAVTFGITALPVIAAAGMGVDYVRGTRAVAVLQSAMDAAVLAGMAASSGQETATAAKVLAGNFTDNSLSLGSPTWSLDNNCGCLTGTVTGTMQMSVGGIMQVSSIPITVTSKASNMKTQQRPVTFVTTPVSASGWYPKVFSAWTKDSGGNFVSQVTLGDYLYNFGTQQKKTTPTIGSQSATMTLDSTAPVWGLSVVVYNSSAPSGPSSPGYCAYFCGSNFTSTVTSPPTNTNGQTVQIGTFRFLGDCTSNQGMQVNFEDGGDNNYMDYVATIKCTMGNVKTKVMPYLVS